MRSALTFAAAVRRSAVAKAGSLHPASPGTPVLLIQGGWNIALGMLLLQERA